MLICTRNQIWSTEPEKTLGYEKLPEKIKTEYTFRQQALVDAYPLGKELRGERDTVFLSNEIAESKKDHEDEKRRIKDLNELEKERLLKHQDFF